LKEELNKIKFEISKEEIQEEMSKNMAEDKDKITLLSMIAESQSKLDSRKLSFGGPT